VAPRRRISPLAIVAIVGASILFTALLAGGLIWAGIRIASRDDGVGLAREQTEVVDEGLRFRFADPGPEWHLFSEAEARRMHPDAAAGLVNLSAQTYALLIVEPAYGLDLVRAVEAVRTNAGGDVITSGTPRPVRLAGRDAMTFDRRASVQSLEVSQRFFVLVHDDHIYQVCVWHLVTPPAESDVDAVLGSFEILPGRVVDHAPQRVSRDLSGPLWQLEGGVLTHAAHRVRLRSGERWHAIAGAELDLIDPTAEGGLEHDLPSITMVVHGHRLPGADIAIERERLHEGFIAQYELSPDGAAGTVDALVLGRTIPFAKHRRQLGFTFDYRHGVVDVGDGTLPEIVIWTAAPQALDVRLAEALARIEVVSEAEALAIEAAQDHEDEDGLGPDAAIRRGRFRAYQRGVTWQAPGPAWRTFAGTESTAREADAQVVAECPRHGIRTAWWAADPTGLAPAAAHAQAIGDFFGPGTRSASRQVRIGDAIAVESSGQYRVGSIDFAFTVRTAEVPPELHVFATWYPVAAGAPSGLCLRLERPGAGGGGARLLRGPPVRVRLPRCAQHPGLHRDRKPGHRRKREHGGGRAR
jgi:hypothetical protein